MKNLKYIAVTTLAIGTVFAFTACSSGTTGNNVGNAWDGYGTDYNYGSGYDGYNGTGGYGNGYYDAMGNYTTDGMLDGSTYRSNYGANGYTYGTNGVGTDYLGDGTGVMPYNYGTNIPSSSGTGAMVD